MARLECDERDLVGYCRTVQNLAIIFWIENVWITLSPYKLVYYCHITNKI